MNIYFVISVIAFLLMGFSLGVLVNSGKCEQCNLKESYIQQKGLIKLYELNKEYTDNVFDENMEITCDKLCRHPYNVKDQKELDEICNNCPLHPLDPMK